MNCKHILFLSLSLSACTPSRTEIGVSMVPVSFSVVPYTKAAFTYPYEKAVNSVQISVYDTEGNSRLAYSRFEGKDHGYVMLEPGIPVIVFAMVNGPDMSGYTNAADYGSQTIGLDNCSRNPESGFVMVNEPERITIPEGGTDLTLSVTRPAARISLSSITNGLGTGDTIILERMFLIDFISNIRVSMAGSYVSGSILPPSTMLDRSWWADMLAWPGQSCHCWHDEEIVDGGRMDFSNSPPALYSMPNTGPVLEGTPMTQVVIQCRIRGIRFYYPVPIPQLLAGKDYSMQLLILGFGSSDPRSSVSRNDLQISIEDNGWESGPEYRETI